MHNLSREITKQVVELKIDFGIVVNPARYPELVIRKLYSDTIGFWKLRSERSETLMRARKTAILCHPHLTQTKKLLQQLKQKKVFPDARITHTSNLQLIADLMAARAGVGVMPETTALLHHRDVLAPIRNLPTHPDTIFLVFRKDALLGRAAEEIKCRILRSFQRPL